MLPLEELMRSIAKGPRLRPSLEDAGQGLAPLLKHPYVERFCAENPEVTGEMLFRALTKLYQAVKEYDHCARCPGLERCPNLVPGHRAHLRYYGRLVDHALVPCEKYEAARAQRAREKLIRSHYVPKEIMQATFASMDRDPERLDALNAVMEFCLNVEPGSPSCRGLYLYGPLGVGKSHMMGAAARKLAERGIASIMVYSPDFFREIKDAIQDHSLKEKVDVLKKVPVLILDDIGAESLSPWARDEVLGAILHHRAMEHLPTLYTSNYDYDQLERHLAQTNRGDFDELKAKRIMERIRHYTDAYFVNGVNRRVKNKENSP
ncbi:primosomal protein DnaI [Bacillaceae bacterium]